MGVSCTDPSRPLAANQIPMAYADEAPPCSSLGGCVDLSPEDLLEISNLIQELWANGDAACRITGNELAYRVNNGKIKYAGSNIVINQLSYWGIYNKPTATADPDLIILSPQTRGGWWERRSTLIHEAYHGQGFWSNDRGVATLYEDQAIQHEYQCGYGF